MSRMNAPNRLSPSDERTLDELNQAQRRDYLKGVVALIGVAAAIVLLLIGFAQMGTV